MNRRLVLLSLILVLIPIPIAEYTLEAQFPPVPPVTFPQRDDPTAYAEQRAFLTLIHYDPSGLFTVPGDYAGRLYSATDGLRTTTGLPTTYTHTVYLLGPSNVLDAFNPDAWTIASLLQALLPSARVVNLGIHGGLLPALYARLRTVALRPGDTVVLYFGTGESGQAAARLVESVRATYNRSPCSGLLDGMPWNALVHTLCAWWNSPAMAEADMQAQVGNDVRSARLWVDRIHTLTTQNGAYLTLVLAPTIVTRPLSAYERTVITPLTLENVRLAYPLLVETFPTALNLAHVLDDERASGHEVFYDWAHISGDANALVAKAIYDRLAPIF